MPRRRLLDAAVRVGGALLGGGIFYSAWLALFLLVRWSESLLIRPILWFSAPLATGFGSAAGAWAGACLRHTALPFKRVLPWTIAGCVVGALAVYWYGPMLIAFTMLACGTAAVAVREMVAP